MAEEAVQLETETQETETENLETSTDEEISGTADENLEDPAASKEPGEADPAEDAQKKKGGVQKKIDKLTRARRDAEIEAAYWRGVAETQAKATASTNTTEAKKEPDPDDFETAREYADAKKEFDEAQAALKPKPVDPDANQRNLTLKAQYAQAKEKYEDFDEVALDRSLPVNEAMFQAAQGDNLPDILYWLGSNPVEAARIAALPSLQAAREIGKIEAKVTAPVKEPEKKKPGAKPKPEVVPEVKTSGASPTKPLDKMTFNERQAHWEEERIKRIKNGGGG